MQKVFPLFVIFALVVILYNPIFSVYFSHDDFFHFKASQTDGTFTEFIKFFSFPSFHERGYAFYRPIFREALHNIYYSLFGLDSLPMRIFILGIHFINITFVYILMQQLFKNPAFSLFTAFFLGISAAHVGTLYYLAGGMEVAGATMFLLLSVLLFLKKFKFLSLVAFLLSLASHELASVTPLILVGIIFLKENPKKILFSAPRELWPFFLFLGLYLYLDIVKIGFLQQEEQYRPIFDLSRIVNSFVWYSLWSLGIPEMFIDFVGPNITLNPNLMRFWGGYASGIFFFGGTAVTIIAIFTFLAIRNGVMKEKKFWFFLFWFPLALSPVILLPLHKATYYLSPSLPAFWGVIGLINFRAYSWLKRKNEGVAAVFLGSLIASLTMLSIVSVSLGDKTYPAANRGRIAKKLISDVKEKYPELPKGAVVYFRNDPSYPKISGNWGGSSKQAALILNNSDALQLLYKDPTLKVIYEDLEKLSEKKNVYSLVARLQ